MACFVVPLAEAVVLGGVNMTLGHFSVENEIIKAAKEKIGTLQKMLFGGSFFLAIEHYVNGEISFVPPFLTAMKSPEETQVMLEEMRTAGVTMAVLVTAVFGIMMLLSHFMKKSSLMKNLKSDENRKSKVFGILGLLFLSTLSSGLMWSVDFVGAGENGILVLLSFAFALVFGMLCFSNKCQYISKKYSGK